MADIAGGPVGNVITVEAFGNATAHGDDQAGEGLFFLDRVLIAIGQKHGGTEEGAAWDDGDFVEGKPTKRARKVQLVKLK